MSEKKEVHIEYMGNNLYVLTDINGEMHLLYEVVKCKDCKYWAEDKHICEEENGMLICDPDDFCSRGVRKDG